jgi:hypothetical protein
VDEISGTYDILERIWQHNVGLLPNAANDISQILWEMQEKRFHVKEVIAKAQIQYDDTVFALLRNQRFRLGHRASREVH